MQSTVPPAPLVALVLPPAPLVAALVLLDATVPLEPSSSEHAVPKINKPKKSQRMIEHLPEQDTRIVSAWV